MKFHETLSFLSLPIDQNRKEYEWFKKNVDPTYKDNAGLKEDLYSVDAGENALEGDTGVQDLPKFIETFLEEVKAVSPDVCYLRFVNF